jgi:hypothetical protein
MIRHLFLLRKMCRKDFRAKKSLKKTLQKVASVVKVPDLYLVKKDN